MLKNAYQLIQAGDKGQAKQIVAVLLEQNQNDPDALYLEAYFAEQPDQKIELLERILAIQPDHPQAKKILAQVQLPSVETLLHIGPDVDGAPPNPGAFDLDGLLLNIQRARAVTAEPKRRISPTTARIAGIVIGLSILVVVLLSLPLLLTSPATVQPEVQQPQTVPAVATPVPAAINKPFGPKRDLVPLRTRAFESAYSPQLDTVVTEDRDNNRLEILALSSLQEVTVQLPDMPACLSISPDGMFAAVCHHRGFSYIDLKHFVLVKTL